MLLYLCEQYRVVYDLDEGEWNDYGSKGQTGFWGGLDAKRKVALVFIQITFEFKLTTFRRFHSFPYAFWRLKQNGLGLASFSAKLHNGSENN